MEPSSRLDLKICDLFPAAIDRIELWIWFRTARAGGKSLLEGDLWLLKTLLKLKLVELFAPSLILLPHQDGYVAKSLITWSA